MVGMVQATMHQQRDVLRKALTRVLKQLLDECAERTEAITMTTLPPEPSEGKAVMKYEEW